MPHYMLSSWPSDPFGSCSLKTKVFAFLVPLSSGLSWKVTLFHRWSTLRWNFVFLACEFGADRSFPAPWWDPLTDPLAPEPSVTVRGCFWGSCWHLPLSHGARCTSTDEDLEGRLCHGPPQGQVIWRAWLAPSLWFPPLEHDRENGEWVSNIKFPQKHLGRSCQKGPVCKLRGLHSKLSRGTSWLTPESSVMNQPCNLHGGRRSEEHALSGEELSAWTWECGGTFPTHRHTSMYHLKLTQGTGILDMMLVGLSLKRSTCYCFHIYGDLLYCHIPARKGRITQAPLFT